MTDLEGEFNSKSAFEKGGALSLSWMMKINNLRSPIDFPTMDFAQISIDLCKMVQKD